jgi:hypothetical protein
MASPAARDPGPFVTFVLSLTVEKVDSIVISSRSGLVHDVQHVLGRVVVEAELTIPPLAGHFD